MTSASPTTPSWDDLFDLAAGQDGLFSTAQAAEAGYSPQLLQKHLRAGRVRRVRRGVYRLVHFPPGEHEDLAAVWLWSNRAGVFSHETALSLHELSDGLTGKSRTRAGPHPRGRGRSWSPASRTRPPGPTIRIVTHDSPWAWVEQERQGSKARSAASTRLVRAEVIRAPSSQRLAAWNTARSIEVVMTLMVSGVESRDLDHLVVFRRVARRKCSA